MQTLGKFPSVRMRRMRHDDFSRRLMRESRVSVDDLIYPVFVIEGNNKRVQVPSMPGVERLSLDLLLKQAEECVKLGIPVMALFPSIDASLKTPDGREAANPDGLIPHVVRSLKEHFPELGVMCDVALDPYTTHGQDGLIDETGFILNDETIEMLVKQMLAQAQAGADIVAPSDMMDGRILAIRETLDKAGYVNTPIMSYAVKYASAFYGPFRAAAGSAPSFGDRKGYQMDPHNRKEALKECALDEAEGADILMVKPALSYLDVIRECSDAFDLPMCAYSVSGEYAMIKAAGAAGLVDEYRIMCESALSVFRAGANMLITYYAKELAQAIQKGDIG